MRIFFLIFSVAALGAIPSEYSGKVVGITDGDTVTVLDESLKVHKVRLNDIDAPEKKQPFGTRARQELAELCFGKEVLVKVAKNDRYGREIATLYLPENKTVSINFKMVETGYAWHYEHFSKNQAIHSAQTDAKAKGIGLWVDPNPVPPWLWRHPEKEEPDPQPKKTKRRT